MNIKIFKACKRILFLLPVVLGIYGLSIRGEERLIDALFNSLLMYVFCYAENPENWAVEVARWLAPMMTASGILTIVQTLRDRIHHFLLYKSGKSIAVYGPDDEKEALLNEIGRFGINGKQDFVPASRYILLDDEQSNFTFYYTNKSKLSDSMVYLKCRTLPAGAVCESNLSVFCPEETSARLFWKENCIYSLSKAHNHEMDIVLIGFDKLGENLLLFGLQNNIFSPNQKITYHVFGDGTKFRATHTELDSLSDSVVFEPQPWYDCISLIEKAAMVIVLTQENQMELLHELLFAAKRDTIHVFTVNSLSAGLLHEKERLMIFDWKNKAQCLEHILSDTLFQRAKKINLRYAHLYSGVEESDKAMELQWKCLDTFTRYSNVSSADYHEVRLKMLEEDGGKIPDSADFSADRLELLAELEHIRWCRYHYLNNWKYGIPAEGKAKDKSLRIHRDLIPYQALTDGEKEKDRENIRILHSI